MPQFKVFLSGPGGVGKSHVIKLVHYATMKLLKPLSGHFDPDELPVLLTAFTGTAAFGIEGMTLHSSLGFSSGPKNQKQYQPAGSEKLNTLQSRLSKLKLLMIDEVSMVGADLLYHAHRRLQDICGTSDQDSHFGGVSVLAVGDLYQLQPVGQSHVFGLPSDSYAPLHGSLWEEIFKLMELTESMRQKDDQHFAQLLMRVRTATCTQDDINLLKTRVVTKTDSSYPANALHVFKTNKEVDQHNAEHLKKLPNTVFDIKAVDQKKDVQTGLIDVIISTKLSHTGGLREVVSVAVGARVMVTVNTDVSDGLANGVCGTVVGIESSGSSVHTIFVKFDSRRVGMQAIANSQYKQSYPEAVPIKRQDVHLFAGRGRRSVEAKRSQFPLSLAWGCTIHKVQGKTMDQIVVSMEGKGLFMPGQAYVALSRVKKLNGLFLLGFDATSIRVNPAVVREME
ncbi:ATP-dependent DNA helicase PIF1-like [Pholidichthys leucotaenia]